MEYLQRIERWALFLAVVTLPLITLPAKVTMPIIGGDLPMICVFAGLAALFIEAFCYRNVAFPFKCFWLCYAGWLVVTLVVGAARFPYYAEQMSAVLANSKFQNLLQLLSGYADENVLFPLYVFSTLLWRMFKTEIVVPIGLFVLIYHLYGNDWKRGFNSLGCAARVLVAMCCAYSVFEVIWLWTGNAWCADVLKTINVCLYDPQSSHGWWPPLLWKGQLRSMFQEPPFFSITAVFLIPFMWYRGIYEKRKIDAFLLSFFLLMLFMTNSRTAIIVYLGQLTFLTLLGLLVRYPGWKRATLCVVLLSALAFGVNISGNTMQAMYFPQKKPMRQQLLANLSSYVDKNISSAVGTGKRSNTARYGNVMARIYVGLEHPVFGTGWSYESVYMKDKFPSWAAKNAEVKTWQKWLKEKGFLKSSFPILNEYTAAFSRGGILGVLLFLCPPLYVFYRLWRKRKLCLDFRCACLATIVVGQMACIATNWVFLPYVISLSLLACAIIATKHK